VVNHVVVSGGSVGGGGGVPGAAVDESVPVGSSVAFGVDPASFFSTLSSGQAGAHPDFTTAFAFNQSALTEPVGSVKDVSLDLPPGLVVNPTATPRCDMARVEVNGCPGDTAVGDATLVVAGGGEELHGTVLVFNIAPYADEPAAFAFSVLGISVRLDGSVRGDNGYTAHVSVRNVSEILKVAGSLVTLWGVPADHNGPGSGPSPDLTAEIPARSFGGPGSGARVPLVTGPTGCEGPAGETLLAVDSWQEPGETFGELQLPDLSHPGWARYALPAAAASGCEKLSFQPSLAVTPENTHAGQPTGYTVDLGVPQNENPDALATAALKDALVTLPPGTVLSPSAASGLQACSEAQVGLIGVEPTRFDDEPVSCPAASRIGSVQVETPLLEKPLKGSVYLAQQNTNPLWFTGAPLASANPFGSLFALYLLVEGAGVRLKLAGETYADPVTGQITTSFTGNPPLPFSDLKLSLNGGSRAPLANPVSCAQPVAATALLNPYSGGAPVAPPVQGFLPEGCPAPQLHPTLAAATIDNRAAAFSPFTLTLTRTDADEPFAALAVRMPPGLLGILRNVTLCPERRAARGACGPGSLIGHTTTGAGPGPTPFYLPGRVYLTGPFNGAPFGLSIVVPAKAGPFDLGTVVVRAAITVDPGTAQLTITTGRLPKILAGIPLQIKAINVTVDRPQFIFNPTSCEPLQIHTTIASTGGLLATPTARFQAAECATLPFTPTFTASTSAHASRANGASLHVHIAYPPGTQANIHAVSVALPKQLPARLTTIQKACPDTIYNNNPALCPPQSLIGIGVATTPILTGQLAGPVYLVSHGGAAFPDITIILQGQGIRADLTGNININKQGITSSTFATVPDVPITTFDLVLPEGPHSGLGTNGNLCAHPLTMPTTITAQNNTQTKQNTKIHVNGCTHKTKKTRKHKR
jgi:hypothetical protein